jgi:hypothetical protein
MPALCTALFALLLLGGCASDAQGTQDTQGVVGTQAVTELNAAGTTSGTAAVPVSLITSKVKAEDTDSSWDLASSTLINLNGTSATVEGSGAQAQGSTVTITAAGTYVISGTLTSGSLVVQAQESDLVRLVLNGASITASENAAIYVASADKAVVILAEGTQNTLSDKADYHYVDVEGEEPNAALFSKCDLSLNGTGSLKVIAAFKHGIATKDDLVIASGTFAIDSVDAALRGKDSLTVLDGTFTLSSKEGDGMKTANETESDKGWLLIQGGIFTISASHDGISAASALQIDTGVFAITSGGGWPGGSLSASSHGGNGSGFVTSASQTTDGSFKGVKSGSAMVLNGGAFTVSSLDDAIHSNADITVAGGTFTLQSGDDGIHAENTLAISGGKITVMNCYEGLEAAVVDISGGETDIQQATDDGINASGTGTLQVNMSGGVLKALASSDCLDSNGTVNISGGTAYLMSNATRDGDAMDTQGTLTITGGTVVYGGLLSTGAAPAGSSTQSYVYLNATITSGDVVEVRKEGAVLVGFTAFADCRVLAISAPSIVSGQSYDVYAGDTLAATVTAGTGGGMAGPGGMGGFGTGGTEAPDRGTAPGMGGPGTGGPGAGGGRGRM